MLITFLIAALASIALASGVPQNPCDCKAECESLGGWRYCYVEGGASCELAWRSWIHPGEAYVPCPAAEPKNDGISRPERSLLQFNDDDDDEEEEKQDCKGDFGDFGECEMKAGELQKCRVFKIETPAAGDGKECKNEDGEEECESEGCDDGEVELSAVDADVVANVDCEEYWGDWGECQMKDGEMQRCRTYEVKAAAEEGMECERGLGEECESEGCVMKTEMLAAPMVSPERPESVVPTKEAISLSLSGGSFIEVGPSTTSGNLPGAEGQEPRPVLSEEDEKIRQYMESQTGETLGAIEIQGSGVSFSSIPDPSAPLTTLEGTAFARAAPADTSTTENFISGVCLPLAQALDSLCGMKIPWPKNPKIILQKGSTNRYCTWECRQCLSDIGNIPGKAAEELEKIGRAVENVVRNNLPSEVAKCQGVAGCYEAVGQAVKNRLPEDVRKIVDKGGELYDNTLGNNGIGGAIRDGLFGGRRSLQDVRVDAACDGGGWDTLPESVISERRRLLQNLGGWDGCTTEIPCSGFSKQQCGMIEFDVPVGVDWEITDTGICDIGIPGLLDLGDLVEQTKELCPCLLQVLKFLEDAGGDPSNIDGALVEVVADLLACAVTNGPGTYTTNYNEVVSGLGGDAILGAPIDMSMYIELAVAIATFGVTLKGTAQNYVTDTINAMTKGIKDWLLRKALEPLNPIIKTFQTNLDRVKNLPSEFQAEADNCLNGLQNNLNGVSADMEDLSRELEDLSKELEDLFKETEDQSEERKEKEDLSEERKKLFEEKDAEKTLIGKLTSTTEELKKLVKGIATILDTDIQGALESITNLDDCFQKASESLDGFDGGLMGAILDPGAAGKTIKSLVDGEVASCIQDLRTISTLPKVVQQIQSLPGTITSLNGLVDDLRSDFDDKCGGVPRMIQSLGNNVQEVGPNLVQALMSLGDIDIDVSAIQPGVASWQHSINYGTMDMPCYEGMDTWGFDVSVPEPLGNLEFSAPYPKFSRCSRDVKVPLPNGHVPYLKIV